MVRVSNLDDFTGRKRLTELNQHRVHGLVLVEVLAERQQLDQARKDLLKRNVLGVPHDHAADATGSVIQHASLLLLVEHGLEFGEDGGEVLQDLLHIVGLLAEHAHSVCGVGPGLGVLVRQTVDKQLHKSGRVRSDRTTHVANAVGDGANSVAALHRLLAAGVLHDRLFEDLPELRKALTKSSRETGHTVKSNLDDEPVILRRLIKSLLINLVTKVLLAGVTLGEDGNEVVGELRDNSAVLVDQNGRAGKLERRAKVAADIGDGATKLCVSPVFSKGRLENRKRIES